MINFSHFFLDVPLASDMVVAIQTSVVSDVSSTLYELRGQREQGEVFQSSDKRNDNDFVLNFEEHRGVQQGLDNKDSSVDQTDAIKSSLQRKNGLFYFPTIQFIFILIYLYYI